MKAVEKYGGGDFACVLGQEMAGYATGEVFFVSQALGLRHSHLDAGGYAYDQKPSGHSVEDAADFLLEDEKDRCFLTSMVACLFARGVYTDDVLADCLKSVGYPALAENMGDVAKEIQQLRWRMRIGSGFRPEQVSIPKRFTEITTWKGPVDRKYLEALKTLYGQRILEMASDSSARS
jgi:aldehyde:ferredoxin oxidoreductase